MQAASESKHVSIINTNEPDKEETKTIYAVDNFNLWYGDNQALYDVKMDIPMNKVTAIIGPSGCGKSTFIKALNRLVELVPSVKMSGSIDRKSVV